MNKSDESKEKSNTNLLDGITDVGMKKTLTRLQQSIGSARAKGRQDRGEDALKTPQEKGQLVKLPTWSESARGVPNSALRGALFAAIQGKNRRAFKRELLATPEGIKIRFTGWQLDQSDMDVWEQCLQLAKDHPLGNRCDFSAHSFLKNMGRATGKMNHEWLKDVFARLAGAVVEITHNNQTYFGALIEGGKRDEISGYYSVRINEGLAKLYVAGWSVTDWEERQALRGKPLALWLHGFYASHAQPYLLTIEYLYKMCGSANKCQRGFKRQIKKALGDLQFVGAINDYEISGDLVRVNRIPSQSQQKHLLKNLQN